MLEGGVSVVFGLVEFVWSVVPLEDVITGALGWLFLLLKWVMLGLS